MANSESVEYLNQARYFVGVEQYNDALEYINNPTYTHLRRSVMNNKTKQGGLGIVSVLTIIFIVLKLLGVIKWSWIWVLSPLWISAVIVLAVFSVILIGGRIKKGKW